jgi:hypothetical protein
MAKRRSKQDVGAKQVALERARREGEFELSKQTPHEQRAWREFELVFNVFAGPRLVLKPDVAARYFGPSGLRQMECREAQWRSHVNHVLVYALDVYCKACGLPLLSTRKHAKTAGVTHTTIARIRGEIRRNPEAYEATRRLYLRHARSAALPDVQLTWLALLQRGAGGGST